MNRAAIRIFARALLMPLALLAAAPSLLAHHGRGAMYDASKEIRVKGVVTEFAWRNPHVVVYVDVKDATGNVQNWGFESSNVSSLSRTGVTRTTLKPGQEITVVANPAREGRPFGVITKVILEDGREILIFSPGANAA